jgi:hypothetical protein
MKVLHQKGDLYDAITFLSEGGNLKLTLSDEQPLLHSVEKIDDIPSDVPQAPTPLFKSPDDCPSSLSGPMSETVDVAARGGISPEAGPVTKKRVMRMGIGFR